MKKYAIKTTAVTLSCVPHLFATALAITQSAGTNSDTKFVPGEDSYRVTFELKSPRRFASRFIESTRTLQIRVIPAKASEFDATRYYDTRFVRRAVVEEENGDVIVSLQLKDEALAWTIISQNDPWRIMVDLWNTEPIKKQSLAEEWKWQDGNTSAGSVQEPALAQIPHAHSQPEPIEVPQTLSDAAQPVAPITSVEDHIASSQGLPENFGRLDTPVKFSPQRIAEMQQQVGKLLGSTSEYQVASELAEQLYKSDQIAGAVTLYRRIAALSPNQFKENPRTMWLAGESAFLAKNFDISSDYYRALLLNHSKSEFASYAKLRLNDIDFIALSKQQNPAAAEKISSVYADLALSENSVWPVKIASTLRLLHNHVDNNVSAAKLYQQNLDACVNRSLVPFELRKNCAYIQTRYAIEKTDILSADAAIQRFKEMAHGDARIASLEDAVKKNIRSLLADVNSKKTWDLWVQFEKKARPELLDFTLKEPDMMYARAESWEAAGEPKKAASLYAIHWQLVRDERKRNETAAVTARLFYKGGERSKADLYLRRLEESPARSSDGIGDRAIGAIRELALSPYRNKTAIRILMDEMTSGRYVEHDLNALIQLAQAQKSSGAADSLYEKILAHPPKDQDEGQTIEKVILQYADNLRKTNRNERAGDMYAAVANTNRSGHRAEAAYKAGLSYARAGLLEKARTSWQMAASDVNDKRYASLAAERLELLK